jgi:hypothetical protein
MLLPDAGIIRQPKWGHLKDLHKAIKLCEEALIATDPTITSPGPNLEVRRGYSNLSSFDHNFLFMF